MKIAAIVLAAGRSTRMGARNKLLIPDARGIPMVARTVDNVLDSRVRSVYIVLGYQAQTIANVLVGRYLEYVTAKDYADGLAHSLKAGIAALPANTDGALICLADMPLVTTDTLDALIDAATADRIVVPVHAGQRGNPVLWPSSFFPAMATLSGDHGARALLSCYASQVTEVKTDGTILQDFDTPASLADGTMT